MDKKTYRIGVDGVYRGSALRVLSAIRKVSTDAALVIAGRMTLRMLVELERRKHLISRRTRPVQPDQVNDDLIIRWQSEWTSSTKGLISNIEDCTRKQEEGPGEFLAYTVLNGPRLL